MKGRNLCKKVWKNHKIGVLPTGKDQIFIGKHFVHEVTSPQAFEEVREKGLGIRRPDLTKAIVDHVIPTLNRDRPFRDDKAELMTKTLEDNVREFGIEYFSPGSGKQGVCHVSFPEQGLIWPGQTAVCGDSHTCTYGAFGAISIGIGTTQVAQVLATQSLAMDPLKVRRVNFNGEKEKGVSAKDLALHMMKELGIDGGIGFAYEYGGQAVEEMSMEERMTLCNLSTEGGARAGYVNPDETTFQYLEGRPFAPKKDFDKAVKYWKSIASDSNAQYDDVANIDASRIEPQVTWGVNPGQVMGISERIPEPESKTDRDALDYIGLEPGQKIQGQGIDVVFIGSCTNGRISDLEEAANIIEGRKVSVNTLVVPGSESVKYEAERKGLDRIFKDAGAEWREPGCSMCLSMNPDQLGDYERSASTSNRNFKGRQGASTSRTHLVSPVTAAASAIGGKITDPRGYYNE